MSWLWLWPMMESSENLTYLSVCIFFLFCFVFVLLETSTPLHFRIKYCMFYSPAFKFKAVATFQFKIWDPLQHRSVCLEHFYHISDRWGSFWNQTKRYSKQSVFFGRNFLSKHCMWSYLILYLTKQQRLSSNTNVNQH